MIKDLTVGNPKTVLWKFSLPLFGSIVFQQLYNIADSLVAGKFVGEDALAAVGNAYEVTLIYLAVAFGCNIGCSVVISNFFGAKKYGDVKTAVGTTFIASAVICLLLMTLGFLFSPVLLHLINTPDKVFGDTLLYLNIYTGGLFFLFFYNISTGIFSALGDSKTPFYFLAVSSVANIGMDIFFVAVLHMGVAGVAWATFLCQGVSCVLAVAAVLVRLRKLVPDEEQNSAVFSFPCLVRIAVIAVPSMLQQSFISVGNILIQSVINSFGASVMAGYAAAIKLNNFTITSFTTLGNGMSNFAAQNLGAGKKDRVKQGYRGGVLMVFAVAAVFFLVYFIFPKQMLSLFLNAESEKALAVGTQFLRIIAPFYFIAALKLITDGVLRGAGAMGFFMAATFTDLILRVLLSFILSGFFEETGIWLSWPVGWVLGTALSLFFYLRGVWDSSSRSKHK